MSKEFEIISGDIRNSKIAYMIDETDGKFHHISVLVKQLNEDQFQLIDQYVYSEQLYDVDLKLDLKNNSLYYDYYNAVDNRFEIHEVIEESNIVYVEDALLAIVHNSSVDKAYYDMNKEKYIVTKQSYDSELNHIIEMEFPLIETYEGIAVRSMDTHGNSIIKVIADYYNTAKVVTNVGEINIGQDILLDFELAYKLARVRTLHYNENGEYKKRLYEFRIESK
jgi:hypothetical protein